MDRRWLLVLVSAAQLACGLAGLAVAIRRRRAYDLPLMRGDPEQVGRDAISIGTALSAPVPMLATQGLATVVLAARPDQRAARTLGVLGALMVAGCLAERLVRHRLTPKGWDWLESGIAACGFGLAIAMAGVGLLKRARA
jgi:hypothetical protein